MIRVEGVESGEVASVKAFGEETKKLIGQWFTQCQTAVYSYTRLYLRTHHYNAFRDVDYDAEDITQNTFTTAAKTWRDCPCKDDPAPWLFAIARRRSIDAIRTSKSHPSIHLDDVADDFYSAVRDTVPASAEDVLHDAGVLADLVRQEIISVKDLELLSLRYSSDLREREIAAVLGVTRVAVAMRLSRVRHKIKSELYGNKLAKEPSYV